MRTHLFEDYEFAYIILEILTKKYSKYLSVYLLLTYLRNEIDYWAQVEHRNIFNSKAFSIISPLNQLISLPASCWTNSKAPTINVIMYTWIQNESKLITLLVFFLLLFCSIEIHTNTDLMGTVNGMKNNLFANT